MTADGEQGEPVREDGEQGDRIREIVVEVARTELAAITAATAFWAGWVTAADKYASAIRKELAQIDSERGAASDLGGRLSDLTREYLRNVVELPTLAVNQFNSELEKVGPPKRKRTRAARVKD
jgi:hypothetical protein